MKHVKALLSRCGLLLLLLALSVSIHTTGTQVFAQDSSSPTLYLFYGEGCPHCAKEKDFLVKLQQRYPELTIEQYEIYYSEENRQKMIEMGAALNAQPRGVPFTIVGDQYFEGFGSAQTTGQAIEQAVIALLPKSTPTATEPTESISQDSVVTLPLLGDVAIGAFSLPLFTIIVAGLDGFNPCAMWALIFLIGILINMKDRKRMWILGSAFIITSGLVYFLFLSAWLNVFLVVGYIWWIRITIGLLALGAGVYYLRDAYVNREGACKVTQGQTKQKVFGQIKTLTANKQFAIALVGIILLAIAVNMVELVCSAGLPAIYTQVLSLSQLPTWQYYAYLALYILVFMLDDLLIFFTAMFTLRVTGLQGKYSRYSHIIGGVLMLILGALLIFKPEWLMFG